MEQENFFHTDYSFLWHFWPSLMFYYCRYLASSCRQAQWREFSNTEIVQNNISNYFLRTQNLYMRHSLHLADGKEDKLFILKKHIPCSKVASQNIYFSYWISSPIVQSHVFKAWFSDYATAGLIHGSCLIILHDNNWTLTTCLIPN